MNLTKPVFSMNDPTSMMSPVYQGLTCVWSSLFELPMTVTDLLPGSNTRLHENMHPRSLPILCSQRYPSLPDPAGHQLCQNFKHAFGCQKHWP